MLTKRVAIGLVTALGLSAAVFSPAFAGDDWKQGKHHKHRGHHDRDRVVYIERPPVYVTPRPHVIYVEPEPAYVYYPRPRPRVAYYPPPGVSLTFNFD